MNKAVRFLKKNWILIWVLVAALGVTSFWAYAEFIEVFNHTQKVVANTSDSRQRFSSDYLSTGTPSAREIGKTAVPEQLYYEIPFKIWNYDSSNSAKYYTSKLEYTLEAQLVHGNNALVTEAEYGALNNISATNTHKVVSEIGIKYNTDANYTTFEDEIYGDGFTYDSETGYKLSITEPNFTGTTVDGVTTYEKDEHGYVLRFPAAMLANNENIYVRLTAQPGPNNKDLKPIYAVLSITGSSALLEDGWQGKFNDDTRVTGSDFDGYNYVISGNGSADVTFKWRPDRFEVNKFFFADNGIAATDIHYETKTVYLDALGNSTHTVNGEEVEYTVADVGVIEGVTAHNIGWKYFTMHVNSDDEEINGVTVPGKNRYDIQLYMTANPSTDYADWDTIESYVEFSSGS